MLKSKTELEIGLILQDLLFCKASIQLKLRSWNQIAKVYLSNFLLESHDTWKRTDNRFN